MKILIVEDVTLVAQRIESLCFQLIEKPVCDLAFSIYEASSKLARLHFDLVFLDINVNGENGFQLIRNELIDPNKVIVVTAHQHQAVTSYELEVFDFIHKPVTQKRFTEVVQRFHAKNPESVQSISLKKGKEHYKLSLAEVSYLKASGNYTEIYSHDGNCHLSEHSLNYFDSQFKTLLRCHRSFLVKSQNVRSVVKLGAGQYRLVLEGKNQIPLSRSAYKQFFND